MTKEELVVLVDKAGQPRGTCRKSEVHHRETPLHLAFSIYLFNPSGEKLLMQQRALHKPTWPGFWANSCCGHPGPGESLEQAAIRRLEQELGITGVKPILILPDFAYRAVWQDYCENEFCPVLTGVIDEQSPAFNVAEVNATTWVDWDQLCAATTHPRAEEDVFLSQLLQSDGLPAPLAPWTRMQTGELLQSASFQNFFFNFKNI